MNEVQLLKVKIDLINSKQQKKGKIYRGANFTAYNRSNLGSIPSNVENVIFQRPNDDYPQGFLHKSQRFDNYIPTVKVSFSNKDNESSQLKYSKSFQNLTNLRYLNENKVKYFGSENRFEQPELIRSKFSPGPGEYSPKQEVNKSFRYQSIFADRKGHPLPQKETNSSNIPQTYISEKEELYSEKKSIFIAKAPRFVYKEKDDMDDISGPGFFEYASTFNIKQKGKLSSFFKGSVKQEDSLKSQFLTALQNNNSTSSLFHTERKNQLKPIKSHYMRAKPFSEIKEEKLNELKSVKKIRGPNYYLEQKIKFAQIINSGSNNTSKENKSILTYISKGSKREIIDNKIKHIPGPGYYDPIDIHTKKYFHFQDPKIWI